MLVLGGMLVIAPSTLVIRIMNNSDFLNTIKSPPEIGEGDHKRIQKAQENSRRVTQESAGGSAEQQ